jgi:hypothetical protein
MFEYRRYRVSAREKQPLLDFMLEGLREGGCRIVRSSSADEAPFRISFETSSGERLGIVAYAFRATRTPTPKRPADERSFQIKYGSKASSEAHEIWVDPYGLYTTLFLGIDPEEGFFVGVDPQMHNPTKLFIRFEFKDRHAEEIKAAGWHAWERQRRSGGFEEPVEAVIGGTRASFLRYVYLERAAQGLDQGHRLLLAERPLPSDSGLPSTAVTDVAQPALHPIAQEFELSTDEILDIIASARRLKMAVRGWVAEEHLRETISTVFGVTHCRRLDAEGGPDLELRFRDGPAITIECKNVLRRTTAAGVPRVDFQRTRASQTDRCSRYYSPHDFDVVAACLHAVTLQWEFRYRMPIDFAAHPICAGKLASNVEIGSAWSDEPGAVLARASDIARRREAEK